MSNILNNLKLDSWYKVLLYLGSFLIVISATVESKGVSNRELIYLGLGFLAIGLGEFKSRKIVYEQKPPNAYTGPGGLYQHQIRRTDLISILLDITGVILLLFFLFSFLR